VFSSHNIHVSALSRPYKEWLVLLAIYSIMMVLYSTTGYQYAFNRDTWYFCFSNVQIIKSLLDQGVIPFVDPYSGLGFPLLFRGSLDLMTLPLLMIMDPIDYLVSIGFLYFLLGIFFMYRFLEKEISDPWAALVGAAVWGTNGFFLWHLHELVVQSSAVIIPLQLMLIRSIGRGEKPRRMWIFLTLATAIQLTYGRWEIVEYGVGAGILYATITSRQVVEAVKTNLFIIAAVGVGIFITAPFSLNYIQTIIGSARGATSLPVDYYSFSTFFEHFFPNIGRYDSRGYLALFIFPCALVALLKPTRLVIFGMLLASTYIVFAYPIKLYELVRLLPMHSGNITVIRTNILFYLGTSIVGAYGLHCLFFDASKKRLWTGLAGCGLIGVVLIKIEAVIALTAIHFISFGVCIGFFLAMAGVCLSKHTRVYRYRQLIAILMVVYTCFFSWHFNKTDRNDGDLAELSQKIQSDMREDVVKDLSRKTGGGGYPNWRAATDSSFHLGFLPLHRIPTTNIYSPFPSRTMGFISEALLGNSPIYSDMINTGINGPTNNNIFYSLSSVKYFLVDKAPGQNAGVLLRNEEALEPIRFCNSYEVVPDERAALEILARDRFNIAAYRNHCILDEDPFHGNVPEAVPPEVTFVNQAPDSFALEVRSPGPALMVVSNQFDPSWRLSIDGKRARIYRINGFLQGIRVEGGTHLYDLIYIPHDLERNLIISGSTLAILLLFSLLPARLENKKEKLPAPF